MHLCQRFFQSSKHFSSSIFGIAFSSFSDALLMSSMLVKRRPFKILFIFGNRKKSHGAMSGKYGGWGIVTVLFLAKNSWTSNEVWAGAFCCYAFHTQNIRQNFMAWANWYANIISDFSDCNSAIVHNNFFHFFHVDFIGCWCAGASGAFVIFNVFTAILEMLISLVNSCFTHSRLTIGLC